MGGSSYPVEGLCDVCGTQLLGGEQEVCDVCYDEAHIYASTDDQFHGTIYYDLDHLE